MNKPHNRMPAQPLTACLPPMWPGFDSQLFKWLCHPFTISLQQFERLRHPFTKNLQPFKWLLHPFTKNLQPFNSHFYSFSNGLCTFFRWFSVWGCQSTWLIEPFVICSIVVRFAVRTDTCFCV